MSRLIKAQCGAWWADVIDGQARHTGIDGAMAEQEASLEENAVICLRLQEQRLPELGVEVFLRFKYVLRLGTTT